MGIESKIKLFYIKILAWSLSELILRGYFYKNGVNLTGIYYRDSDLKLEYINV